MQIERVHLSDAFLHALAAELDDDATVGIVLGGSHARGEATIYSDVDLACFVREETDLRRRRLFYRDGLLISVGTKTVVGVRREAGKPNTAIWVVPGIAGCRVLLDKDGSVERLIRDMTAFSWEPLQAAAHDYAGYRVLSLTETVHKLINETAKGNDLALAHATQGLFFGLTEAVAVGRGVLVQSDSTYYHQVQEAAGLDSAWTHYHRLASGTQALCEGADFMRVRSRAALHLYRETAALLAPVMDTDYRMVVQQTLRLVAAALRDE